ncbi:hypothetical protein [Actinomadura sp. DC4]|uniref:hypothetical protein n=1 Tax=Actinomadura sp. DC4 TaxID=3055069 RepID=UPI0025B27264|nr:hypothetical protein [Actinomadura sp. DC4]MDN3356092.1 hypothetical protein [Actinomadura sp. DC4]
MGWLQERLGYRGLFLANHGIAWVCYGIGVILDPAFGTKRGLGWMVHILPFDGLGWLWILCGLASVVYAPLRRPGADAWGFFFILFPPTLWGLAYLLGIPAYARGGFSAIVWISTAISVVIVALMPEPKEAA